MSQNVCACVTSWCETVFSLFVQHTSAATFAEEIERRKGLQCGLAHSRLSFSLSLLQC